MSALRKKILAVLVITHLAALIISLCYTLLFIKGSGTDAPDFFACRFKEVVGLYCPGCGGSRALFYFLSLDWVRSFIYCPAILVTVGIIAAVDVRAIKAFIIEDLEPVRSFRSVTFLIIPAVLLLNFVVRNILLLCGIDYIGDIIPFHEASVFVKSLPLF